jgi:hypothetical protein
MRAALCRASAVRGARRRPHILVTGSTARWIWITLSPMSDHLSPSISPGLGSIKATKTNQRRTVRLLPALQGDLREFDVAAQLGHTVPVLLGHLAAIPLEARMYRRWAGSRAARV